MKEILKLNLVDSGIPGFVLKNNRILVGVKVVKDKEGNDVEKNVYEYELDEKFCKERYSEMVNGLTQFSGILVIYGVNRRGKKERIDFINSNGGLRDSFRSSVKKGMCRYEWMKNELMEGKYRRIDFNLGVKI